MAQLVADGDPVSVLFSGGVDSTIVAAALSKVLRVELVSIHAPTSRDRVAAVEGAERLGRPLRVVDPRGRTIEGMLERESGRLAGLRGPALSVQVALAVGVASCSNRLVLTGQGSDELFGGYAHFAGRSSPEADELRRRDLDRLIGSDWPLSRSIASDIGKELGAPFLEGPFREFALTLPIEPAERGGLTKRLLRRWAIHRGIPAPIAERPKVALQYGSGVERRLREMGRHGP